MENGRLERDMISEPRLWRLAIGLGDTTMDVVLTCSVQDNSLIWRTIQLDKSADTRLRAIEDAIYDNPLLLCDFGWVDVVFDTPDVTVIPGSVTSDDCINDIADATFPAAESATEAISCNLHGLNASLVMRLNADEVGFLRRTYYNVRFHHRLAPLCRHFYRSNSLGRSAGKTFALLRQGAVDIMAFGSDQLRLAVSFRCQGVADAIYFILATRKMLGMTVADELLLSGDPDVRAAATPVLREYIGSVMPVVFPSELMRCGHDAIHAPLELIILPSCE